MIIAELVPIAQEFNHFRNLRWSSVNHHEEISVWWEPPGTLPDYHGVPIAREVPLVRWFDYLRPPDGRYPTNRFLLLMNRDERKGVAHVRFTSITGTNKALREIPFPASAPDPAIRIVNGEIPPITVDGWDMRLFWLTEWPGP